MSIRKRLLSFHLVFNFGTFRRQSAPRINSQNKTSDIVHVPISVFGGLAGKQA